MAFSVPIVIYVNRGWCFALSQVCFVFVFFLSFVSPPSSAVTGSSAGGAELSERYSLERERELMNMLAGSSQKHLYDFPE